jgi:non-specific serine/threonine protein kinase
MSSAIGDHRSEAAELFYDRASRVLPTYPHQAGDLRTVNRLCDRLDGLPLAIELAAPWVRTLSVRDLLIEIERSADVLASTNPTLSRRHRSMRAVWDSTWRSLTSEEQRVLSRLSVFRGGFTRETAEAVADASRASLHSLSEHALIRPPPGSDDRYGLHELVRQYADDMLHADGLDAVGAVRQAHLDYFLRLYERAREDLDSPRERQWTTQVRVELPNARAALTWALDSGQVEPALRMTAAVSPVWGGVSGAGPHLANFEAALALPWDRSSAASIAARASVLNAAGYATMQTRGRGAIRHFAEAEALYEQLGDEINHARGLSNCGLAILGEDPVAALGYRRHGLAICERAGDPFGIAWLTLDLGEALFVARQNDEAEPLVLDGQRQLERLGVRFGVLTGFVILGHAYRRQHRWREAIEAYAGAIAGQQETMANTHGGDVLAGLAVVALALGRTDCAAWMFGAGRAWDERYGTRSVLDPRGELDAPRGAAVGRLSDPDWAISYRAGQRLTREQALERALSDTQELLTEIAAPIPLGLTERELQVVRLVAEGLSDADVATKLGVSRRTVHTHLRSVYGKTNVRTRTAAVHELQRLRLLESG